jgi:hypothetical protein
MKAPLFCSGIVRLGGIFVAPFALVASTALAGCSGTSGDGTGAGDDGTNAGDGATATSPPASGDDADTSGSSSGTGVSSSGQSASSSGSTPSGSSSGVQDVDSGGSGSGASSGASSGAPVPDKDASPPGPASSSGGPHPVDAGAGSSGAGSSGGTTPPAATATFTQVFTSILSPTCNSCHGFDAPNMSFASKSTAYADLVGVSAQGTGCGTSGEKRVVAGSSATSLLYMKVAGTETCGARMPKGKAPLSQANITLIKNWIDEGALNN